MNGYGAVLLSMAVARLLFVDTPWEGRDPFIPVFNKYAVPALLIAACLVAAAIASRRFREPPGDIDRAAQALAGLAGVLLIWMVLSVETYQSFTARMVDPDADVEHLQRAANTSLSVVWAVYAALVLALGFRLRSRPLRWTALGLFGLTLGKVFLVDMAGLSGFYRVVAFFVLSVMMGAAAWGYQKIERARAKAERERVAHENV